MKDYCGGTVSSPGKCNDYISASWVAGTSVSVTGSGTAGVGSTGRRHLLDMEENINMLPESEEKDLLSNALKVASAFDALDNDIHRSARHLASSYSNTYSSTGYDSTASGCNDNPSAAGCKVSTTGNSASAVPMNIATLLACTAFSIMMLLK